MLGPPAAIAAWLPPAARLWLGRRLGDVAWTLLPGRRALALENLTRALGRELPTAERRRLARASFHHLGMTAVEACALLLRPPAVMLRLVEVAGLEHLERAAARGRGVLLLTAHLGNWELLAAAHALTGRPLSEVVRPLDQPVLDRLVARLRRRTGVEVIAKQRGLRGILEALRRRRMVGILLDQNASRAEGVFVPFFGILACTSRGMALAALRSRAPVLPVFIRRGADGRHRVQIHPELPPPADRDPVAFTAAFTAAIEAEIRRVPQQWLWVHRRWRTRPPGEP